MDFSHSDFTAAVATSQPQANYAALSKSLQSEWTFTVRANNGCSLLMNDFECCLLSVFLSALFSVEVTVATSEVRRLDPVAVANHCLDSSVHSTTFLYKLGTASFELNEYVHCV